MARRVNYLYEGNEPWGQAISNLGLALFGDPMARSQLESAESARETAELNRQLLQEQIAEKQRTNQTRQAFLTGLQDNAAQAAPPDQYNGTFNVPMPTDAAPESETETGLTGIELPTTQSVQLPPSSFGSLFPAEPSAQPAAPPTEPRDFGVTMASLESGGSPTARTQQPGQSASGLYGFTDETWLAHRPQGAPDHAWQATEEQQRQAFDSLTEHNRTMLGDALSREPSRAELAMAHRFGATGALNLLNLPPTTPVDKALAMTQGDVKAAEIMRVNPDLAGKTIGDVQGVYVTAMGGEQAGGGLEQGVQPAAGMPAPPEGMTYGGAVAPLGEPFLLPPPQPAEAEPTVTPVAATTAAPPAAPTTGGPPPTEPRAFFQSLSQIEQGQVMSAADPQAELGKLYQLKLTAYEKAHPEGGGPFAGTSVDASALNNIYAYQTQKARGEPTTPDQDYSFQLSKYQLEQPKIFTGADGKQYTYRYRVPEMAGAPPQAEIFDPAANAWKPMGPTGAETPPPAAPTAPATAAPTTAPAPGTQTTGGVEIAPLGTGEKQLPADARGPYAAITAGQQDLQNAVQMLTKPDGTFDTEMLYGFIDFDDPKLEYLKKAVTPQSTAAATAYKGAIGGLLRSLGGQALTPSEQAYYMNLFMPKPGIDRTDAQIRMKVERTKYWLQNMAQILRTGQAIQPGSEEMKTAMQNAAQMAEQQLQSTATQQPSATPQQPTTQQPTKPAIRYKLDPTTGKQVRVQ
jgi:hypothetical protein